MVAPQGLAQAHEDLPALMGIKTVAGRKASRAVGMIGDALESEVQKALFEFMASLRLEDGHSLGDYAYAVPNGTMLAGTAQQRARYMASLKAQGLKPGVSDVVIALPRGQYHGAYIELKRTKGGVLSVPQSDWLVLTKNAGYYSALAAGLDEAVKHVQAYAKMGPFKWQSSRSPSPNSPR